jgi:phage-related protein
MTWTVEILDDALEELRVLPRHLRAKFEHVVKLVEQLGLEQVHEPCIKHLEDELWEMRMKGQDGIARAIYVTARGRRIVVVRVFRKKTQKTPQRELELAHRRA